MPCVQIKIDCSPALSEAHAAVAPGKHPRATCRLAASLLWAAGILGVVCQCAGVVWGSSSLQLQAAACCGTPVLRGQSMCFRLLGYVWDGLQSNIDVAEKSHLVACAFGPATTPGQACRCGVQLLPRPRGTQLQWHTGAGSPCRLHDLSRSWITLHAIASILGTQDSRYRQDSPGAVA